MSETTEWIDEKYTRVFDEELLGLVRRSEKDPAFSVLDAEGILKNLYIMDGNDWTGRGFVGDTTMSATIAAYEHFIVEAKKVVNK